MKIFLISSPRGGIKYFPGNKYIIYNINQRGKLTCSKFDSILYWLCLFLILARGHGSCLVQSLPLSASCATNIAEFCASTATQKSSNKPHHIHITVEHCSFDHTMSPCETKRYKLEEDSINHLGPHHLRHPCCFTTIRPPIWPAFLAPGYYTVSYLLNFKMGLLAAH